MLYYKLTCTDNGRIKNKLTSSTFINSNSTNFENISVNENSIEGGYEYIISASLKTSSDEGSYFLSAPANTITDYNNLGNAIANSNPIALNLYLFKNDTFNTNYLTGFGSSYYIWQDNASGHSTSGLAGVFVGASCGYSTRFSGRAGRNSNNQVDLSSVKYITINGSYSCFGDGDSGGNGYAIIGDKEISLNVKTDITTLGLDLSTPQTIIIASYYSHYCVWQNWYGGGSTTAITSIITE